MTSDWARNDARTAADAGLGRRHVRVAAISGGVALGMLAMAYAAVPLYQMFCQVTGFNGTTQRAAAPSSRVLERQITVRFDANVGPGLGWSFEPVQRTVDVKLGESTLVFYRATNRSERAITGSATFNVTPEITGAYFSKMECFCFKEQTLAPGESIEMPVSFYVDPEIVGDKDASKVRQITLSYTFYPVEKPVDATINNVTKPTAREPRRGT